MEQQDPWAQSPQTVLPNVAPQLPSTVGTPVGLETAVVEGLPKTGSPEVVVEGGRVFVAEAGADVLGVPSEQPFWQPLVARQWPSVDPQ